MCGESRDQTGEKNPRSRRGFFIRMVAVDQFWLVAQKSAYSAAGGT